MTEFITVRCGCMAPAEYAVYEDRQPHCKSCMLDAVDTTLAILVRTLDPWEQVIPLPKKASETDNAPGGNPRHRRTSIGNFQGQHITKNRRV